MLAVLLHHVLHLPRGSHVVHLLQPTSLRLVQQCIQVLLTYHLTSKDTDKDIFQKCDEFIHDEWENKSYFQDRVQKTSLPLPLLCQACVSTSDHRRLIRNHKYYLGFDFILPLLFNLAFRCRPILFREIILALLHFLYSESNCFCMLWKLQSRPLCECPFSHSRKTNSQSCFGMLSR